MPIASNDPALCRQFSRLAEVCSVNLHGYRESEWDVSVKHRSDSEVFQCTGTDMLDVASKALNEAESRGWITIPPTLPLQVQRPAEA